MRPIAAPKFDEYVDFINDLSLSGVIDALPLARVKRDITENLVKTNPADAHALLGMIASLENKPHKVVTNYFDQAIRKQPGNWFALQNYTVALMKMGFMEQAYLIGARALEAARFNEETLGFTNQLFEKVLISSLRFNELAEFKRAPSAISEFLTVKLITDDDLRVFSEVVEAVASENEMITNAVVTDFCDDGELLYVRYGLKMDVGTTSKIADALIDELIGRDLSEDLQNSIGLGFFVS